MSNYGKELEVTLQMNIDGFSKTITEVTKKTEKASEQISKEFSDLGENMTEPIKKAGTKMKMVIDGLNMTIVEVADEVEETCNEIGKDFAKAGDKITKSMDKATASVKQQTAKMANSSNTHVRKIGTVFQQVSSKLESVAKTTRASVTNSFGKLKSGADKVFKSLPTPAQKAFTAIKTQASKLKSKVSAEINKLRSNSEKDFKKMGNSFKTFVTVAITGFSIKSILTGGSEVGETTKGMAKLTTAFQAAGSTAEQGTKVYKELYGVLGDSDRAVETAQLMSKLTTNTESMAEWTSIATGVLGTYGDALPIESMIESANETAKVGEVTGVLADALNWAGESEEAFNEKLAECTTNVEREALIRETLNGLYNESSELYKENNKELIAYNESQAEMKMKMAELEKAIMPFKTAIIDFGSEVIEVLTPALKTLGEEVLPPLQEGFSVVGDVIKKACDKVSEWVSTIDWEAVKADMETIGGYLKDTFTPAWNTLKDAFQGVVDIFESAWEALFGEDATAGDGVTESLDKLKTVCKWFADHGEEVEAGLIAIAAGFGAFKAIQGIMAIPTLIAKIIIGFSSVIGFITSPIFLIAAGIAVVVGLVWYYWDEIKAFFKLCVEKCKEWWDSISQWFSDLWTSIEEFFVGIWNTIEPHLTKWFNFIKGIWEKIFHVVSVVLESVWLVISKVFEVIWIIVCEVWNKIWEFIQPIIQKIGDWISEKWEAVKECFANIWGAIKDKFIEDWNEIKEFFQPVIDFIQEKVVTKFTKMKDKAIEIFNKIKEKIEEKMNTLKSYLTDLPDKIKKAWNKSKNFVSDFFKSAFNSAIQFVEDGVNRILKGVRWVMNKLDMDSSKITDVELPQLAKGTAGWQGGTALVGEAGRELVHDRGQTYMVNEATLINLSKGAKVLSNPKTEALLRNGGIPAFAKGKDEGWFSSFTDTVKDVWGYVTNPSKLIDLMFEKLGIGEGDNFITNKIYSWIKGLKSKVGDFITGIFSKATPDASNVSSVEGWRPLIQKAASYFGETLTANEMARVLQQIRTESGGNQKVVQSMAVWDINAQTGNLARGLLQYVPSTFNMYKVKGFGDITNGYHQLLAFFNNSSWRKALPQLGEKRGWSPRGSRRKARNGILVNEATSLTVGEAGYEAVVPLSNATALKPFGQSVMNALKEEVSEESTGGTYEFTIPLYVDGKEIARATAQFTKEEIEKLDNRSNRLKGNRR